MELLPVKKTFVCYEQFKNLKCIDFQGYQFEGLPKLSVNEIGTAVTFSVDRFLSPDITLHKPEKVVDNFVIIHFKEDKFSLEVIKNGILEVIGLEIPMMISFANDKVFVGEEALKMKENYNAFVVSDILKLLSSDFKINESNPEWGFKVIKNKENQNLVVFQTFRGQRKTTPLFLLSILMKWAMTKAEVKLEKQLDTVVIVMKPLHYDLKQILINACNGTKGEFNDIQIHKNKIVQIKES
uniref:Uncharacterized protein n=1 Tax=Panagrolaimus davidi TaxID=227884 RepID=A0A914Q987_9BILA